MEFLWKSRVKSCTFKKKLQTRFDLVNILVFSDTEVMINNPGGYEERKINEISTRKTSK